MNKKIIAIIAVSLVVIPAISIIAIKSVNISSDVIYLHAGWNFITVPVVNNFTAESLGQYIGDCDTVAKWDAELQDYISHPVGTPINDFSIEDGVGYMIHMTEDKTIEFQGVPIQTWTVILYPGNNYIANIYPDSMTAEVFGGLFTSCDTVMKWDAELQNWVSHPMKTPVNNFDIPHGMAVCIHVGENQVWHGEYTQPKEYVLSTSVYPEGAGRVSPSEGTYVEGDVVKVRAYPSAGYIFDYWSGDVAGSENPITITMDSNKTITANFYWQPSSMCTLNLDAQPPDGGNVYAEQVVPSSSVFTGEYPFGAMVKISAVANDGYTFRYWYGEQENGEPIYWKNGTRLYRSSTVITMYQDYNIHAVFVKEEEGNNWWIVVVIIVAIFGMIGIAWRKKWL